MKTLHPPTLRAHARPKLSATSTVTTVTTVSTAPSESMMLWPSIAALALAADNLGGNPWQGINDEQRKWVPHYNEARELLSHFSDEELVRTWAETAEEINRFLADRGFGDISLDPWAPSPNIFGVAAVQRVHVEWQAPGVDHRVIHQGGQYPGVRLKKAARPSVRQLSGCENPVVVIPTKSKTDVVILTEHPHIRGFELIKKATEIASAVQGRKGRRLEYDEVAFPKVHLDQRPDVSWLLGLTTRDTKNRPWDLVQAVQQNRLMLDLVGARVEAAFAGAVMLRCAVQRTQLYSIENPFLAVVARKGCPLPVAAAWLNTDVWKAPPAR